jgi:hypothetical protein
MKRLFLVPMLGLATLALTTPAWAQSVAWLGSSTPLSYSADERQSYNDSRRAAYDNGYKEGVKEGEKDGRRHDAFRYEDEKSFQRADKGYHREYGDLDRYRQSFRNGYSTGYSDSYQRYGVVQGSRGYGDRRAIPRAESSRPPYYPGSRTYPPSYPGTARGHNDAAFQNGAGDGYGKGVEDARKNRSFDPLRHAWYRAGDRRYEGRFGSREQYKDVYRLGFKEGYERGYREGRYR